MHLRAGTHSGCQVEVVQALLHCVDVAILLVGFFLEVVFNRAAEAIADAVAHLCWLWSLVARFAWRSLSPLHGERTAVYS